MNAFNSKKGPGKKWTVLLALLTFYFLYQWLYGWNHSGASEGAVSEIAEDQVAFVVIKENNFPSKSSSFKPLLEGLKVWEMNEEENKIRFKFDTLLPTDKSKVMLVYDRGFESFERHAEVFSVNIFPYQYYFEQEPFVSVYDADKDGTVYLEFKGKRIKLGPNDSYRTFSFNGIQGAWIKIENHGLFKKDQFKYLYTTKTFKQDLLLRFPQLTDSKERTLLDIAKKNLPSNKEVSLAEKNTLLNKTILEYLEKTKKKD